MLVAKDIDFEWLENAELNALISKYRDSGDIEIRNRAIEALIPLAKFHANKFADIFPDADADDLFSESMIGLTKGFDNLVKKGVDPNKSTKGYLSRAIKYQILDCDEVNRAGVIRHPDNPAYEVPVPVDIECLTYNADPDSDLEIDVNYLLEHSDFTDQIARKIDLKVAMERLTPMQTKYIRMYYWDNMNSGEISRKLGKDTSTVGKAIREGLQRIEAFFTEDAESIVV